MPGQCCSKGAIWAATPGASAQRIVVDWENAGFVDVRADPLPGVLELDHAHGVAPGHSPQLQHRISGRRPERTER